MGYLYGMLALVAGTFIPLQAGINALLANRVESTVWAAFASFTGGTLVLFGYLVSTRATWPTLEQAISFPWWLWSGGVLGAFLVWTGIVVIPKIGATALVGFVVTGQLLASLALDHFGLLGVPTQEISAGRVAGAFLLIAGVLLIRKY